MQTHGLLTKRQKETLDFMVKFTVKNGYSPSLQEIADFLKTENLSTAQYFVQELEKKGYLKKKSNIARGITLNQSKTIPLLGYIAAGKPIEPIENPEDITLPPNIQIDSLSPHYALKIKGDSMIDMGILDGDIVIIKHQFSADSGNVVVAVTEDGATLKVLRKNGTSVYLQPKNSKYPNIYPKQLEIRGKFIGLIRPTV